MKVRGSGTVLISAEGRSPPLPFIEVEDGEALALIAQKLAVEVSDEEAELAQVEAEEADEDQVEEPAQPSIPVTDTAAQAKVEADIAADRAAEAGEQPADEETAEEPADEESTDETPAEESTDEAPAEETVEETVEEGETREEMIAEALDLVEADGLVKNGDRAGKPKVSAIEAITGLTDVTADEIDAAVAAREAA